MKPSLRNMNYLEVLLPPQCSHTPVHVRRWLVGGLIILGLRFLCPTIFTYVTIQVFLVAKLGAALGTDMLFWIALVHIIFVCIERSLVLVDLVAFITLRIIWSWLFVFNFAFLYMVHNAIICHLSIEKCAPRANVASEDFVLL